MDGYEDAAGPDDLPAPATILDHALLAHALFAGAAALVAVSGGTDSVPMLHAIAIWARRADVALSVGHVNHELRGAESDADETLVRDLAAAVDLPFHRRAPPPPAGAASSETVLRRARHAALADMARESGARAIVLGHHAGDLTESFLMHLARGTGLRGLIFPAETQRGGLLWLRPMSRTPPAAIRLYATAHGLSVRHDPTNMAPVHARNRARHQVAPVFRAALNPDLDAALALTTAHLAEAHDFLLSETRARMSPCCDKAGHPFPIVAHAALPAALRRHAPLAWLMAQNAWTDPETAEAVARLANGGTDTTRPVPIADGLVAVRHYATLLALADNPDALADHLAARLAIPTTLPRPVAVPPGFAIRHRQPGDRAAFGGKLKAILHDDGVPAPVRDRLLVLADPDQTVWSILGLPRYNGRVARLGPEAARLAVLLAFDAETPTGGSVGPAGV